MKKAVIILSAICVFQLVTIAYLYNKVENLKEEIKIRNEYERNLRKSFLEALDI